MIKSKTLIDINYYFTITRFARFVVGTLRNSQHIM